MKGNLRDKRSDPWLRANASPKATADPALNGKDARDSQSCLCLVRKPAPASADRSELRGLTQEFSEGDFLNGPAMRPTTPLAVENSVGEPAAHEAPNVGIGKESVASSHSQFCPRSGFGPGGDNFLPAFPPSPGQTWRCLSNTVPAIR